MILLLSAALAAPATSYHLDQARQFVKNGWYDDAAEQIEAGLATPEGAVDFELNWLGAQVYQELIRMDRAAALARRAADLAPNDDARARCEGLYAYLVESWGQVRITAPYEAMRSRLQLEARSPIYAPEEKRLFNQLTLELREPTTLPVVVSLPVGEYLVNGAPVVVVPGGEKELALGLDQLGAKGLAALQVSRLEVSVGALARWGLGGTDIGPTVELAFTQPLGPVLLGVVADWDPRAYATVADSRRFDPLAPAAGLRIGRELVVGGPLAVRPSVGARWVFLPGVRVDCAWTDATRSAATCTDAGAPDADLAAYVDAQALAPFGELAVEYRQGGRTTALGVGVKVAGEAAYAWLPGDGEIALGDGTGAPIRYESDASPVLVPGVRLCATLDFAF